MKQPAAVRKDGSRLLFSWRGPLGAVLGRNGGMAENHDVIFESLNGKF